MTKNKQNIALIGYGKMGGAMHRGWLEENFPADYHIISPSQNNETINNTHYYNDITQERTQKAIMSCDVVLLCVKPQVMQDVCNSYKPYINHESLIISVAAGITLNTYESIFSKKQAIIRAMPNTPCSIGKGVTGIVANDHCEKSHVDRAMTLLGVSGDVHLVDSDDAIDRLSAISGSGPAYVFYLVELLTQAGVHNGIPPELAETLARSTVIGASSLLESDLKLSAAALRRNVTSPAGTTEAALNHLMDGRIQEVFDDALAAAIARAKEL